jgi:putative radical SAM enzyme (TIGR03279 family)
MIKRKEHIIHQIEPGSIAEELELEPGDVLVSVNGQNIHDIFDYHYLINEEYLELLIRKPDGEEWELEIEKEYEDDLGIVFENGLMDEYRSCRNKCMFCFIDQLPKGMRDTLYFKDDDSRLSFLQGNYVTLTNMSDEDVERIIRYHLSPINISFHTMNPELRCKMLNNRFAGDALEKVEKFYEAGISMNGQVVLCKGINDGAELEYSIEQLTKYLPHLQSVSVVPVGLTDHREGLYPLEPFDKEDACKVLELIHRWQERLYARHGTHFVHAGDEWYLLAGQEVAEEDTYDGYLQLENGVGMVRLLHEEIGRELMLKTGDDRKRKVSIATGALAAPLLKKEAEKIRRKYSNVEIQVYSIENAFFGRRITVAGLLTGQDLERQLKNRQLGEALLLTEHMMKSGERIFLDDMTVEELSRSLQVPVIIVESDGKALLEAVLGDS